MRYIDTVEIKDLVCETLPGYDTEKAFDTWLEGLIGDAYSQGYDEGRDEGYDDGWGEGFDAGRD